MLIMFTVYDQVAKAHLPPFVLPHEAQAERTFSDCVNDAKHQFGQHPADYTLLAIADFDEENGKVIPYDVPTTVGTGIKYVQT